MELCLLENFKMWYSDQASCCSYLTSSHNNCANHKGAILMQSASKLLTRVILLKFSKICNEQTRDDQSRLRFGRGGVDETLTLRWLRADFGFIDRSVTWCLFLSGWILRGCVSSMKVVPPYHILGWDYGWFSITIVVSTREWQDNPISPFPSTLTSRML